MIKAAKSQSLIPMQIVAGCFAFIDLCLLLSWAYKLIRHSILLAKNWKALEVVKPQINANLKSIFHLMLGFIGLSIFATVCACAMVAENSYQLEDSLKQGGCMLLAFVTPVAVLSLLQLTSNALFWRAHGPGFNVFATTINLLTLGYCFVMLGFFVHIVTYDESKGDHPHYEIDLITIERHTPEGIVRSHGLTRTYVGEIYPHSISFKSNT